ncbi:MAG: adenosylcobinamide amidohydrolase [Bacilli bacterium]
MTEDRKLVTDWTIEVDTTCYILKTAMAYDCLSGALYGGGKRAANFIFNGHVDVAYHSDFPQNDCYEEIKKHTNTPEQSIGMLTAVKMEQLAIYSQHFAHANVDVIITAGISNGVEVGKALETFSSYLPGTINCVVLFDGQLSESAKYQLYATIVEAKTAALTALCEKNPNQMRITGTSTDCVVLATKQKNEDEKRYIYAGSATEIGNGVAQLVRKGIMKSLGEL